LGNGINYWTESNSGKNLFANEDLRRLAPKSARNFKHTGLGSEPNCVVMIVYSLSLGIASRKIAVSIRPDPSIYKKNPWYRQTLVVPNAQELQFEEKLLQDRRARELRIQKDTAMISISVCGM